MESQTTEPKTFIEAVPYFKNLDNCINYLAKRRWPNGVACPTCGRTDVSFVPSRRLWQCKTRHPKAQFSIKTGTILEDSPLGLEKWLPVMWMVANCKNGVSSWEIHRSLGVTQKTAWFMLHRIRLALAGGSSDKLGGDGGGAVEIDETFVSPDPKKMHPGRRRQLRQGQRDYTKAVVLGMLDREARQVRAMVIPNVKWETLQREILAHVENKSAVYTDQFASYEFL